MYKSDATLMKQSDALTGNEKELNFSNINVEESGFLIWEFN